MKAEGIVVDEISVHISSSIYVGKIDCEHIQIFSKESGIVAVGSLTSNLLRVNSRSSGGVYVSSIDCHEVGALLNMHGHLVLESGEIDLIRTKCWGSAYAQDNTHIAIPGQKHYETATSM